MLRHLFPISGMDWSRCRQRPQCRPCGKIRQKLYRELHDLGEHQASQTRTTPHRYSRDDPLQGRTRNIAHNSPDSPRTPTNHFPQHPTPRDSREHYRATQERSPYFMQMYAMLLCTQEKTIDNHKPTLNQQQTNDNTTTNSRKIAPSAPCLGTPRSFRGTLTRRRAVALVLC